MIVACSSVELLFLFIHLHRLMFSFGKTIYVYVYDQLCFFSFIYSIYSYAINPYWVIISLLFCYIFFSAQSLLYTFPCFLLKIQVTRIAIYGLWFSIPSITTTCKEIDVFHKDVIDNICSVSIFPKSSPSPLNY